MKKKRVEEKRYWRDQDHKTSRKIVDFALKNDVSVLKLEDLTGIRDTTRASRKNKKELHKWSRYQLLKFLTYKAAEQGIEIVLVNPRYTSQTCPSCKKRNKSTGRKYKCSCNFEGHRDIVGATNILSAPVIDGIACEAKNLRQY